MGRPTDYSEDVATIILALMIEGRSLRKICQLEDMPDASTVYRWLHRHPEFRDNYAKAQQDRTTVFAEELLEISDQYDTDAETLSPDLIQRAKLRIDTRKWLMSKMDAKRWGDKITQEHTGADGSPIVFTTVYEAKPQD